MICRRSEHSSLQVADELKNENQRDLLKEIRKCLTGLEKEKKLVTLTQKLNEMEAEKAVGFPDN